MGEGRARVVIAAQLRAAIDAAISDFPQPRGALLTALHLVQAEHGYISHELADAVAEIFALRRGDVLEVVSFYNMLHDRPQPRHQVGVCTNLPCSLRGARTLLKQLEAHCGAKTGVPSADGRLVLQREECLGACAGAPVLRIDGTYHENLALESARHLLDGLD